MDSIRTLMKDLEQESHTATPLPIFGVQFHEPIWDEEFPGSQLDRLDKLYIEMAITEGKSPFFISSACLSKLGYAPKDSAIPHAVMFDGHDCHPIYAVHDIYKLPKRRASYSSQRSRYSRKWKGLWATATDLQDGRWINKSGVTTHYGLSASWIARLETWMQAHSQPVLLKTNHYNPKGAPVRLYDRDVVEGFMRLHEFELKRWKKRYRRFSSDTKLNR